MKKSLLTLSLLALALCAHAPRRALTAARESVKTGDARPQPARAADDAPEHFAKDGLAFDYPKGFKLADRSNEAAQHLVLTREGSSVLVMVIAYRDRVANREQFEVVRDATTTPYAQNLARSLGIETTPSWDEQRCLDLGEQLPTARRFATGFRLSGKSNGQPTTGEVYAVALGQRFVNLVYVRNDKDDAQGAPAWKTVIESLNVDALPTPTPEGVPVETPTAEAPVKNIISGGVLNGKAVVKPQPNYPAMAKAAREQGVVTILIVVDEEGNVTSAKAVSGPPILKGEGEKAASQAKFTPTTICGHPVKVSGVITYNFILQ